MKFILGTKQGMTQVFREDGAVQVGFGEQKKFRVPKAQQGHLKDLATVRYMRDVRAEKESQSLKRGDTFTVKIFTPGDKVQVVGWSKGKGFQGVVKRHGFRGGPRTHGHKDNLRMPGTIGAGGVQRVFKNVRMGGHMGDERVTIKNLEIVQVDPAENIVYIKGAVPGARGGLLLISGTEGTIEIETTPVAEAVGEAAPVEETVTVAAAA
jgi:large subunit ribosomal protein L3